MVTNKSIETLLYEINVIDNLLKEIESIEVHLKQIKYITLKNICEKRTTPCELLKL